jgi:hypothetical protein
MSQYVQIAIYVLCLVASTGCTWLLLKGYRRTFTRLLLWTGLCFAFLSLNSLVVLFDLVVFPQWDLRVVRHAASLTAVGLLIFGLVWESE